VSDDFDPPEGWLTKPLGDAAQLVKDKVEPSTVPEANYIGLEHVEAHTMKLLGNGRGSDVKSAKTKFKTGDVLYGKLRPYLNKVARPPFDGISSTDFLVFTESNDLDAGYLAQFLNQLSVANLAHHLSAGVELPRVDWKSLSTLPISFPQSKDEQRAIVNQVERARGLAASAGAHLDRTQLVVQRFRQAVFAAACSGRLTVDWRIEHGRLTDGHSETDLPDRWESISLGELASSIRGGSTEVPSNEATDFPILRSSSVRPFKIDYSDVRYLQLRQSQRRENFLADGDLLITRLSGSIEYVGNCAVVRDLSGRIQYPDRLFCCRLNDPRESAYVELAFAGPKVRRQIEAASRSAAGHQRISIADLKAFTISRPPLDEQDEIVRRVNQLLTITYELRRRVDAAERKVERTSQAVLTKAFRGDLIPTVAHGEESLSVLQ
jgi:type I restriction enzyme S subunit